MRCYLGCAVFLIGCGQEGPPIVIRKQAQKAQADLTVRKEVKTIAFGSCAHPDSPMQALQVAIEQKADVFIWLGDNIYGDTQDIETLISEYQALGEHDAFKELADRT